MYAVTNIGKPMCTALQAGRSAFPHDISIEPNGRANAYFGHKKSSKPEIDLPLIILENLIILDNLIIFDYLTIFCQEQCA